MAQDAVVMSKCYDCGGLMEGRRENYKYSECGLDSVTLLDVLVFHCKCGAIVPEIPGMGRLHEAIAMDLLLKKTLLNGDEIRFLRKMADFSATRLASMMAVGKEIVSRWENGKVMIGKESDRLLRFVCLHGIIKKLVPSAADETEEMLALAKRMTSLNLPEFFETLAEGKMNDPMQIKLNPEVLAQYGYAPGAGGESGNSSAVN